MYAWFAWRRFGCLLAWGAVGLFGRVPIPGSLILRKKFKTGLAEKLITSQEGYQLYFCIGGGGGGAELLLNCCYKRHFESINYDFQL